MVSGLLVAGMAAMAVGLAARGEAWQRWWFEYEDPRSIALFRIVFSALVLCNVGGLWAYSDLLFMDDGLLTGAEAGRLFAPRAFGAEASVLARLGAAITGPFSLLYVFDGPVALSIHLVVLEAAVVALLVGLRTRVAALVTFLAMDGLWVRNFVFWEGTELVLRVFMVYLVCARSGHAFSVDAWLYRRKNPDALRYRPIPAWPRRLGVVQLAVLLGSAGLLKTGDAWIDGTAVHYALHCDAYARFDAIDLVGTGLLRPLTWAARTAEALFPLVLVGLGAHMARSAGAGSTPRRRAIARAALLVVFTSSTLVVALTGQPRLLPVASGQAALVVWIVLFIVAWRNGGRARWLFGRRVWVVAAAGLLLGMWVTMNIGWFHPAVLACLLLMFDGEEVGGAIDRLRRALGRPIAAPSRPPPAAALAYGPRARALVSAVLGWHLLALAVAALPSSPQTEPLRRPLRAVVGPWLQATRTIQYWGMWAPQPRLDNPELRIVVVDAKGSRVHVDLHGHPIATPSKPTVGYDRGHKIAGRILSSGPEGPYMRPLARWICRRPSLLRDGGAPQRVELHEHVTAIPLPGAVPASATERRLLSVPCTPRRGAR